MSTDCMSNGIKYSPELIDSFEQEHRELLQSYGRLALHANAVSYLKFQEEICKFKSSLVSHLLKEAIKLYIYLRQQLKSDPASYRLVSSYKSEMDSIGKVAMDFIDKYVGLSSEQVNFEELNAGLRDIGKVLGDRIRREEAELYPLYQANY